MHDSGLNRYLKFVKKVGGLTPIVAISIAAIASWSYPHVQAQPPASALFESVTVSPNFKPDPLSIRGISGGSVEAEGIAGRKETVNGPCVGFVDAQPDHVLTLTTFFDSLSIQVQSAADTTLLIRGPGGSWCNDDAPGRGKNPGIAGEWLAGTYEVWIGSYDSNKYYPYVIKITEVK